MLALVRRFSEIVIPIGLVLELSVVMVTLDSAGVEIVEIDSSRRSWANDECKSFSDGKSRSQPQLTSIGNTTC